MSNCIDYLCNDLEIHLMNDCAAGVLGGVDQLVLLDCDHQMTDPTNGTQINAEITAGRAVLVKAIKFGVDEPSPIEVDAVVSCQPPKVVNYDRTATLIDGNVNAHNIDFYNAIINGRSLGGLLFYECGNDTKRVTWINSVIRFTGGRIVPNENNDFQTFRGTFKWKSLLEADIYTAPAGVFS